MECLPSVPLAFHQMRKQPVMQTVAQPDFRPVCHAAPNNGQNKLSRQADCHPADISFKAVIGYARGDVYQVLADKHEAQRHADVQHPGQGTPCNWHTEAA